MTTDGGLPGSLLDLSNRMFPPSSVLAGAEQTGRKLAIRGHEPFLVNTLRHGSPRHFDTAGEPPNRARAEHVFHVKASLQKGFASSIHFDEARLLRKK